MNTFSPPSADALSILVQACLRGDTAAFATLVRENQNLVAGICYSILGNRVAAEEAAQEAFVTAWQQLAALRDHTRVRPWLAGIARHVSLNRRRARRTDPLHSAAEFANETDGRIDPADTAIAREEEAIVDNTLAALPDDYREALVLFYRENQSTANVAAALEISEDAVRQRLVRGRRLLQERVLQQVEHTLRRTGPGAAFALAVLALLPATPAPAAIGGSIVIPLATSVVGVAAGGSLGYQLGTAGAIAGSLCGALGGWIGARNAYSQVRTPAQRSVLNSGTVQITFLALLYITAMFAYTSHVRTLGRLHLSLAIGAGILLMTAYVVLLFALINRLNRRFAQAAQG